MARKMLDEQQKLLVVAFANKQELFSAVPRVWRLVPLHEWDVRISLNEMVRDADDEDTVLVIDVPLLPVGNVSQVL